MLVDAAFLGAAASIDSPTWAAGVLVLAAVVVTLLTPLGLFRLQTKFRATLLSDKEFAKFEGKATTSTKDARELATQRGEPFDVYGDPDQMALLFKAEGRGWVKSTKAMEVPGGCLVQVSTEVADRDGLGVAEALEYVPNARVAIDERGGRLVARDG